MTRDEFITYWMRHGIAGLLWETFHFVATKQTRESSLNKGDGWNGLAFCQEERRANLHAREILGLMYDKHFAPPKEKL